MPLISPDAFDRFAPFYDADYRDYTEDIELIGLLAEESGDPLLELGCGTGRVLAPLAAAGHTLTGVDLSPTLLALARKRLAGQGLLQRVHLVEADLCTFALERRDFALAFCTSNTLMHLTDPRDQMAALKNAHAHLRPGGQILLDLFNPDVLRLTSAHGLSELADQWIDESTGAHVLKWCVRTVDWAAQLQETLFIYEELLPSGQSRRTACPFTLRFLWCHEAELMLQAAGFAVEEIWGDFEGGDYDAASDHLILLARKG